MLRKVCVPAGPVSTVTMSLSKNLGVLELQVLSTMTIYPMMLLSSICARAGMAECSNQGQIKYPIFMQRIPKRLPTCCTRFSQSSNKPKGIQTLNLYLDKTG